LTGKQFDGIILEGAFLTGEVAPNQIFQHAFSWLSNVEDLLNHGKTTDK